MKNNYNKLILVAAKVKKKELPPVEDYKKNVLEWIEDLKEYLLLYDITEPQKVFTWVLAALKDEMLRMLSMLMLLEETVKNATHNLVKYKRLWKGI